MDQNPILQSIAQQVSGGGKVGSDPKLQFSVPCFEVEYKESRAPSLMYIFFDLPFPKLPLDDDFHFHIVNGWILPQGATIPPGGVYKRQQEIKILKPDGSVFLKSGQQPLEFKDVHVPFMAVNKFPNLPFKEEGYYYIVVYLEEREVLRYPLRVRVMEQRPE